MCSKEISLSDLEGMSDDTTEDLRSWNYTSETLLEGYGKDGSCFSFFVQLSHFLFFSCELYMFANMVY